MQGGQESGDKQTNEMDGGQSETGKMIKGDLLRVERYNYLVKGQVGKEVPLNIDKTIQKARNIEPDDHIETKVNDQNHGLSSFPDHAIQDRRNAKD